MFTGIVTDVAELAAVEDHQGSLRRLTIHSAYEAAGIAIGASIACSGPCLTVTSVGARPEGGSWFTVDAAAETLARTTVGAWRAGLKLNLERALRIGDELGGHLVSGHVDGVAEIVARDDVTDGAFHDPLAGIPGAVPHREGLGGAGRHLADDQQRRARPVHGLPHSPHAAGHHLGRDAAGHADQHRGRQDGTLRRAACGSA